MCGCSEIDNNSVPVPGMDIRFVGCRDRREVVVMATECFDFFFKGRGQKTHDSKKKHFAVLWPPANKSAGAVSRD